MSSTQQIDAEYVVSQDISQNRPPTHLCSDKINAFYFVQASLRVFLEIYHEYLVRDWSSFSDLNRKPKPEFTPILTMR